MIKKLLLIFSLILVISSCKEENDKAPVYTWIGGEIVNPIEDYVIIFKGEQVIDSVKLNESNFFLYQAENIETGLYSFSHKEFQVFYLEPQDSLMLRVNTIDFDESLSYTGKGSKKNNFLMEMFLHNEAEIELMPKLYKLSPSNFEVALDSLKNIRGMIWEDFVLNNNPNEGFKEVAEASINYDYYSKKEIYITANASKKNTDYYREIPESFFDYRKEIDFGSESLQSYFPYYRFLFRYFDNIALIGSCKTDYNYKNSFEHNYKKIAIIDSTITNNSLKNSLIRNVTGRFLLNCNSTENQQQILELFLESSTNQDHKNELIDLANSSMKLTTGNEISNLMLVTSENTLKDLHSVINNPTVFYFWSSESESYFKSIHNRIAELRSRFPEYDFIGINTDSKYRNWINILTKFGYDKGKEFQFDDISKAEKSLVLYSINKVIIVDENHKIIVGSTNLFNINVEQSLLGYLNQ